LNSASERGHSAPIKQEPEVGLFPTMFIDRPVKKPIRTRLVLIAHRIDEETNEFVHKLPGDPRGFMNVA
jgi:hypothetical protein